MPPTNCAICQTPLTDYDVFVHEISRLEEGAPARCLACRAEAEARAMCARVPTFDAMEQWERDDCLLTRASFEETVQWGGFIDYDGSGVFATSAQKSDVGVWPSMLSYPWFVWPEWATHVVWYNR